MSDPTITSVEHKGATITVAHHEGTYEIWVARNSVGQRLFEGMIVDHVASPQERIEAVA